MQSELRAADARIEAADARIAEYERRMRAKKRMMAINNDAAIPGRISKNE